MGGFNLMRWLEQEGSNTILTGERQEVQMTRPEHALNELFSLHVESFPSLPRNIPDSRSQPAFSAAEIAAACEKLPISKVVGIQVLKAFQGSMWSYEKVGEILAKDPI